MASGSGKYSGINRARAKGYASLSGAAARSANRGQTTVFQTTNPNAPNYSPF